MKSTTIKGTPYNFVPATDQGRAAAKPTNLSGTIDRQYEGEQSINRQLGATGTPYQSQGGTPAGLLRTASADRYGVVLGENGQDMNSSSSNGNGVILGNISRATDYLPVGEHTLDSPVPGGAPMFEHGAQRRVNRERLGRDDGVVESMIDDDVVIVGGVMGRD